MKLKRQIKTLFSASILLLASMTSFKSMACYPDQYIGSLCAFAGNFEIRGFMYADGRLLPISSYNALFAIVGTTYGGDGRTTLQLPDLRGRSAIGRGQGPGLSNYSLGQRDGAEYVVLTTNQLPVHSHTASTTVTSTATDTGSSAILRALSGRASTNAPAGNVLADSPRRENIYSASAPTVDMSASAIDLTLSVDVTSSATTSVGTTGAGTSIPIRDPYLAINWLVSVNGLFPPRN